MMTMRISEQALDEFKAIYQDEFGEELNEQEAREKALSLLKFFQTILRPIPIDDS